MTHGHAWLPRLVERTAGPIDVLAVDTEGLDAEVVERGRGASARRWGANACTEIWYCGTDNSNAKGTARIIADNNGEPCGALCTITMILSKRCLATY